MTSNPTQPIRVVSYIYSIVNASFNWICCLRSSVAVLYICRNFPDVPIILFINLFYIYNSHAILLDSNISPTFLYGPKILNFPLFFSFFVSFYPPLHGCTIILYKNHIFKTACCCYFTCLIPFIIISLPALLVRSRSS